MNIIDAIKSGKRFRRPTGLYYEYHCAFLTFRKQDILADDWEIEEESVTVTREQASKAASDLVDASFKLYANVDAGLEAFMKALGFKE